MLSPHPVLTPSSPPPHQARSLGSVALRKAESTEGGVHFNVFTVDFNEELVALYGGSLRRQTHFLHESIKAILRLYKVRPQISSADQAALLNTDRVQVVEPREECGYTGGGSMSGAFHHPPTI